MFLSAIAQTHHNCGEKLVNIISCAFNCLAECSPDWSIRLIGGSSSAEGRVEVFFMEHGALCLMTCGEDQML